MSLSIYLETPMKCPHCGGELHGGQELFSKNYTHNVAPMWQKAGVYDALYMSDGCHAGEFIEILRAGVAHMEANFAEYEKLNPPNKWGSAITALPWLKEVLAAFEQNPGAIIQVSK